MMQSIFLMLTIAGFLLIFVLFLMAPIALLNTIMLRAHFKNIGKLAEQLNLKTTDPKPKLKNWIIAPAFYAHQYQGMAHGLDWQFLLTVKRYVTSRRFIPQMSVLSASGLAKDFWLQIQAKSALGPGVDVFRDGAKFVEITTGNSAIDKILNIRVSDETNWKKLADGEFGKLLPQIARVTSKYGQGFGALALKNGVASYYEVGMMSSAKRLARVQLAVDAIVQIDVTLK